MITCRRSDATQTIYNILGKLRQGVLLDEGVRLQETTCEKKKTKGTIDRALGRLPVATITTTNDEHAKHRHRSLSERIGDTMKMMRSILMKITMNKLMKETKVMPAVETNAVRS